MFTFGSLFAGIGGFDLGFERAGMTCAWQVEIDDYANRVLEKHWPDVRRWRDVRTFPPEPTNEWKVDVICGGFPGKTPEDFRENQRPIILAMFEAQMNEIDIRRSGREFKFTPMAVKGIDLYGKVDMGEGRTMMVVAYCDNWPWTGWRSVTRGKRWAESTDGMKWSDGDPVDFGETSSALKNEADVISKAADFLADVCLLMIAMFFFIAILGALSLVTIHVVHDVSTALGDLLQEWCTRWSQ